MNKIHIIGNLTADPELRTTTTGSEVCTFTVAVNRRKTQNNQNPVADFFRVSAWNEKGRVCQKYLTKGKKVSVVGSVSIHVYSANDGSPRGSLEVFAEDVEFLTPKGNDGYTPVDDQDNPFVGG